MWPNKKEKSGGKCVKTSLVVGGELINKETGVTDKISEIVDGGFKLKVAGGPFTKAWIFKYYNIG